MDPNSNLRADQWMEVIPAIRMAASDDDPPVVLKISEDSRNESITVDHDGSVEGIISACASSIDKYRKEHSTLPGSINIPGLGHIEIIPAGSGYDNHPERKQLRHRIAIVTGGAMGYGGGITEELFKEGVNVVIADINDKTGSEKAKSLNDRNAFNRARFVMTDVADPESVRNLMMETVKEFGGLDLLISNAGILHAGGLDEMEPDVFDKMTRVNYNAFFYCAKYASEILKVQNKFRAGYFTDIIQINSKSGLSGSKKNFAYAGAKFGGIGLTQSFALELVKYNIKVNAVCPGNYFEGSLWADPENGLFVQYLKAGKVPGAKTIEEVKKYYESLVPMNRGCQVNDVMKAIYYIIDQKYETGQALPVTGGQIMLR